MNVQPHSGAQANMAVFLAALQPGDTILGLDLAHGGHLTHGMKLNFSGKYFQVASYGVTNDTHRIDFDQVAAQAREHKPKLVIAGASAYPRVFDFPKFAEIAASVGALFLVDMAHIAGLVAAKVHPDPVPHADFVTTTTHKTLRGPRGGMIICQIELGQTDRLGRLPRRAGRAAHARHRGQGGGVQRSPPAGVRNLPEGKSSTNARALAEALLGHGFPIVSGGTDNHLMLVDVFSKAGVGGKLAEHALDAAGITVNKNMIPFDPRKPLDPSGVRIGTPALTTRGMKEAEMVQIGRWISDVLHRPTDDDLLSRVRGSVRELCEQFPVPGEA